MQLTTEYKDKVRKELLSKRKLSNQSDNRFAISMGLNAATYSRLKKGETERLISEEKWLELGRELDVILDKREWNIAQTQVYSQMDNMIKRTQQNSLSIMLVDRCGMGKSAAALAVSKQMPNVIYIDCSQTKKKIQFVRHLAQKIGLDNRGKVDDVLAQVKYYLKLLNKPLVILDEFGDVDNAAMLLIKELWNSTDGYVGWLMIGAEGLEAKMEKGKGNKKVGYAELFSRFAGEYTSIMPQAPADFQEYKRNELEAVAKLNVKDKTKVNALVKKCLVGNKDLRYLKNLIVLNDY